MELREGGFCEQDLVKKKKGIRIGPLVSSISVPSECTIRVYHPAAADDCVEGEGKGARRSCSLITAPAVSSWEMDREMDAQHNAVFSGLESGTWGGVGAGLRHTTALRKGGRS